MTKNVILPGVMCPLHSPKITPVMERTKAIGSAKRKNSQNGTRVIASA